MTLSACHRVTRGGGRAEDGTEVAKPNTHRASYRAHKDQRAGVVSNFRQSAGNIRQYPANPLLPNIAERCRTLPDVSSGNIRQYPAIFLQNPAKSGNIRQYPEISGNIWQYPVPAAPHAISGNLRQYPAIFGNLRHHPAISGSMADCLISGCLCPLVACTPDWGAERFWVKHFSIHI